ncbi:hypothetical protein HZH66_000979 [Vespula vulgaris]|uniref:Uncharacterized protein n=1 Tax=Vespula vulgaris TaxID=7454 RepID=A0A834NLH1_VESVU|nr:hypothetical protein HZH66_000979 [Vespula vulgaris]
MTDANHVSHTCDESIRPHLHQQHIAVAPKENLSGHLRRQLWGELQRANDDTAASHPSLIAVSMIIILLKPVQIVILVQLYQFVIVVLNKLNIVETILSRRHKIRGASPVP